MYSTTQFVKGFFNTEAQTHVQKKGSMALRGRENAVFSCDIVGADSLCCVAAAAAKEVWGHGIVMR